MDKRFISRYSIKDFKRKRKSDVQTYRFEEPCLDEDVKPFKRHITEEDYDTFTDSSNSTTPLYSNKFQEYESSTNGGLSSDESQYKDNYSYDGKSNRKINGDIPLQIKSEKILHPGVETSGKSTHKSYVSTTNENPVSCEQDTFRVDMSRFRYFTSSTHGNSFLNNDFTSSLESPTYKIKTSSATPPRLQLPRKNKLHIYQRHRHNKSVTVSLVPCKGPACTSQICCAHFCSQKCYDNQKWPIGSGNNFKTSIPDYDSCGQQEVCDYGLHYPDHTYCKDHKNIYFNADPNIDCPPFFDLVESIFYDEKEIRIKNPVPIPNCNGDPISSNGYVSQTTKRGRPKRSNVVGLLNSYIFHPSSDVIYTPFIFKESIVEADKMCTDMQSADPIVYALRQCSNLYKEVRADIPKEVLYGNDNSVENTDIYDKIKQECKDDLPSGLAFDDLFDQVADDFSFK